MLDDLIRLKSEIEGRQEYVILYNEWPDVKIKLDDAKPLSEYAAQEDTDGFIKQCESLIENMVVFLSERGIPYDSISLFSLSGVLCKLEFAQKLSELADAHRVAVSGISEEDVEEAQDAHLIHYQELLRSSLKQNISPFLVPLKFGIGISMNDSDNLRREKKTYQEFIKLARLQVSGIVNLNQFIFKMKSLGYDIKTDLGECSTPEEYLQAFIIEPLNDISIIADFTKKMNSPSENKQMQ